MDYLNARFYNPAQGQFLSEDPSFLAIGDLNQVKQVTGRDQQIFLADPQLANSYNYGRDNPITQKDPNGNAIADPVTTFLTTLFIPSVAGDPIFNADGSVSPTPAQQSLNNQLFVAGFAVPAGKGAAVVDGVSSQVAGKAGEMAAFAKQVRATYNVDGRQRILDNVIKARNEFYEAKNVGYQALTRQLRDLISYSKQQGGQAYLTVRDTTQLARTVQQQVQQGNLKVLTFIRDELQKAVTALQNKKP